MVSAMLCSHNHVMCSTGKEHGSVKLPRHVSESDCASVLTVQYDNRFACPAAAHFTAMRH